ncbi:MAG TPA: LysR family transcriptional regulator [Ktedonosporobacter sp.]|nr:LysR family transcriptional regulator [Ktedonosporobacter sp.]
MDLRHLHYFVAVAEELHFGRAAQRLHMAQPPLSQQIRQLEDELEVQLFYRTKRHVQLTEVGQVFLQEARQTLAQAEQAINVARRASRGELGRLAIGFVGSATYEILPLLIRRFHDQYPDVELQLREFTTSQQVRALLNGHIHAGLLRPPVHERSLHVMPLLKEPLVVALPFNHPLTEQALLPIESLAREHFILFPRSQGPGFYDQIISLCQQAGFSPQVIQEAIQMQTITGLVATGLGISLIPASAQHLRNAGVAYRPLLPATVHIEMALAWHKEEPSPVLQAFLSIVKEVIQQANFSTEGTSEII